MVKPPPILEAKPDLFLIPYPHMLWFQLLLVAFHTWIHLYRFPE